jgi:ATP-binding cassette, subfamily B, bacterial HlyB/CyaB
MFVLECRGTDFDPDYLRREFASTGGTFGVAEMLLAAQAHGYEAWQHSCVWEHLAAVPFPALAELRDGRFLVLGAFADDRVLLQDPDLQAHASVLTREQFLASWSGRLVLLTTPARHGGGL